MENTKEQLLSDGWISVDDKMPNEKNAFSFSFPLDLIQVIRWNK